MRLNRSFYTQEAFDATILAFSAVCKVKTWPDKNFFNYEIYENEQKEELEKEFANYCLSLIKR